MVSRHLVSVGAVTFMVSLAANSATAATVLYTDRTAFQSAASPLAEEGFNTAFSAAPTVDFGDFIVAAAFDNVNSANGVTFPEVVSEGERSIYGFDSTPVPRIGNAFRFDFDQPITAFGIDINFNISEPLTADNNGSLDTTTLTSGQPSLFFGVIDSDPFTRVVIAWGFGGDAVGFDYLQYSSTAVVPVPAAAWLLGSGLVALGAVARRRRMTA